MIFVSLAGPTTNLILMVIAGARGPRPVHERCGGAELDHLAGTRPPPRGRVLLRAREPAARPVQPAPDPAARRVCAPRAAPPRVVAARLVPVRPTGCSSSCCSSSSPGCSARSSSRSSTRSATSCSDEPRRAPRPPLPRRVWPGPPRAGRRVGAGPARRRRVRPVDQLPRHDRRHAIRVAAASSARSPGRPRRATRAGSPPRCSTTSGSSTGGSGLSGGSGRRSPARPPGTRWPGRGRHGGIAAASASTCATPSSA